MRYVNRQKNDFEVWKPELLKIDLRFGSLKMTEQKGFEDDQFRKPFEINPHLYNLFLPKNVSKILQVMKYR